MVLPAISLSGQTESFVTAFLRQSQASKITKTDLNNNSVISVPESKAQQINRPVTAKPVNLLASVIDNIAKINESARSARETDKTNGIGLLKGASDFNKNVSDIYTFLSGLTPTISGEDSGKKLLELSKQYSLYKGQQFLMEDSALNSGSQKSTQASTLTKPNLSTIDDLLGQTGSSILGAAGAALSIYELAQGKSDPLSGAVQGMSTGAYVGSYFGVPALGALMGGLAGAVSGLFKKSGKPAEQKERDLIRKHLQQAGILDSNWNIRLANGTTFDMGKDGGAKLLGMDGSLRRYKEFDLSNPLTEPVAKMLAPLAQQITGGHPRLTQEFTAYLTNAANSNAGTIEQSLQNVKVLYAQFGLSFEEVIKKLAV